MKEKTKTSATKTHQPFKTLIAQLVQAYSPVQIYQFAKLSKLERAKSVFGTVRLQKQRTYYILMVTKSAETKESDVQNFVNGTFTSAKVMVQIRTQAVLLMHLNQRNAYLATVTQFGKKVYAAPGLVQTPPLLQPNPKKRLGKNIIYWRKRSEMATGFFLAARRAADLGQNQVCLFLLQEAAKQACMGLIFVFMGDRPDDQNLERLLQLCSCFSNLPEQYFSGTAQSGLLFEMIIKYSVINEGEFDLPGMSVDWFVDFVEGFLKLTRVLYAERLVVLKRDLK